jgi:hypothetical protein
MQGVEDRVRNREDGQGKKCDPDHRAIQCQRGCTEHDGQRKAERAHVADEVLVVWGQQRDPCVAG